MARPRNIPALTGLRFLAASHVVLFHADPVVRALPGPLSRVAHSGYAAVTLFYVLSGFVLAVNYAEPFATGTSTFRNFWQARFARVYPLYALAALWEAFSFWHRHHVPAGKLLVPTLASLATIHAWYPAWIGRTNVPGWSISDEVFFYALFPLISTALPPRTSRARLLLVLAVAWGIGLVPPIVATLAGDPKNEFVGFAPGPRLPDFIAGVALGHLFNAPDDGSSRRPGDLLAGAAIAGSLAACLYEPKIPEVVFHNGLLVPLFATLVYGISRGGAIARALSARPLVTLGEASFALYILQFPLAGLLPASMRLDGTAARYPGYFAILLAASLAAHFWIEQPLRALLHPKRRGAVTSGPPAAMSATDALLLCAFVAVACAVGALGAEDSVDRARRAASVWSPAARLDLPFETPARDRFLGEGWSGGEFDKAHGLRWVWAVGRRSVLQVPLTPRRATELRLVLSPFVVPGRTQTVEVVVNGSSVALLTLEPLLESRLVQIPARVVDAENRIEMKYAYATSPKQLAFSEDPRELAVVFHEISFGTPDAAVRASPWWPAPTGR